ncbi:MAG: sensor histidine kinase [Gemmobacter sp.]|nr:sensor histidine kinase [Gemmobacter sp.]
MPLSKTGPVRRRLGVRLMAAVGMALMPLALLAYVQADRVHEQARNAAEAALFGQTLLAATPQIEAINAARGIVRSLSLSVQPLVDDPEACSRLMRRFTSADLELAFVGFIPIDGHTTCSSSEDPVDFSASARLKDMLANPRPVLTVNLKGHVSGEPVLVFNQPVKDEADNLLGFMSISVPHRALELIVDKPDHGMGMPEPISLVTFDRNGTVLTSQFDIETEASRLPVGRLLTDFVDQKPQSFSGTTPDGQSRIFAVVPMVEGQLYTISSWMPTASTGLFGGETPLWLFPAAMWFASLLVAWIATEYEVLRHVRALRLSIIAFAGGNRTVNTPDMDRAAVELRDVGEAYERMIESVLHDEAEMEDMVHQKEVLLREVHHRVKNNLQLISSIMNIQMRKAASPEAKALLKGLQDRVMSLATVHRELYQTSGLADVRADELLAMIVAQVLRMGSQPGQTVTCKTDFEDLRLTPDQSVPLSLILTEALTNVLKHAGRGADGKIALKVTFRRSGDGHAELRVANSTAIAGMERAPRPEIETTGIGEQLLFAFASQLGGDLKSGQEGDRFVVSIDFPLRSLAEAEERFVTQ